MSGIVGNLFGSKGQRAESTQSSGFGALPSWAQDAYKTAIDKAQGLSSDTSLFTPTPFNADQNTAFGLAREGFTPINNETFGGMLSTFQNPFEEQVVQNSLRDIQNTGRGLLSDLGAGASSAGGFGGSRQAILESDLIGQLAKAAGDTSANIRSQGFNNATANALASIGMNNANTQQQFGNLMSTGALQQGQAMEQQQAPLQALSYLLSSLSSLPNSSTGTSLGAQQDQGFLGRLSNIASGFGQAAQGFRGG